MVKYRKSLTLRYTYIYLYFNNFFFKSLKETLFVYKTFNFYSLFFKGFLHIAKKLQVCLPKEIESAAGGFHTKEPRSSQYYQVVPVT